MKVIITSNGGYMTSKLCPNFEECEYLIIYDIEKNFYGSRVSPSFKDKDINTLINFCKKTYIPNVITGKDIDDKCLQIYKPKNMDITVEEAIMEYIATLKK